MKAYLVRLDGESYSVYTDRADAERAADGRDVHELDIAETVVKDDLK